MKPKRPSIAVDRADITDFLRQSPRPGQPTPDERQDGMTPNVQAIKTPSPQSVLAAPEDRDARVKLTVYVDPEDLEALEDERRRRIRAGERRRGSDVSALIREAIRARYRS
jgi:hypothetical protein